MQIDYTFISTIKVNIIEVLEKTTLWSTENILEISHYNFQQKNKKQKKYIDKPIYAVFNIPKNQQK